MRVTWAGVTEPGDRLDRMAASGRVLRGFLQWEEKPRSGMCAMAPAEWRRVYAEAGGGKLQWWPTLPTATSPPGTPADEPLCSVSLIEPAAASAGPAAAQRPTAHSWFKVKVGGAKHVFGAPDEEDKAAWLAAVEENGQLAGA